LRSAQKHHQHKDNIIVNYNQHQDNLSVIMNVKHHKGNVMNSSSQKDENKKKIN